MSPRQTRGRCCSATRNPSVWQLLYGRTLLSGGWALRSESQSWSHLSFVEPGTQDTPPPKKTPLLQRTRALYAVSMFRWLLILLILCQTGSPRTGTCWAENSQVSRGGCCSAQSVDQVPSCCRLHASDHDRQSPRRSNPQNSDRGGKHPCCGCCQTANVYCQLPESSLGSEQFGCDRVMECHPLLLGISRTPLTPPPDFNGVG